LQGRQIIYVSIQDQNHLPVAGAHVSLRMQLASGEWIDISQETDSDQKGLARFLVPFQTTQPDRIIIEATARWEDRLGTTTTSFQTWW
jgi:hypothetical protein